VSIFLKIVAANIFEKEQKPKPCGTKFQKFGLNYNEMTLTLTPNANPNCNP